MRTGAIIITFFEIVGIDVLLNPLGVNLTKLIGLVVFMEVLADIGFIHEGLLTVWTVRH